MRGLLCLAIPAMWRFGNLLAQRLNRGASLVDAKHGSSELLKLQSALEAELAADTVLADRNSDGWCVQA